jgi:hydrogenase maturation factor
MRAAAQLSVACDHDAGCITCGDTAVAMRVVELEDDPTLARCAATDGGHETVDTSLVGEVVAGAVVLVHAGVAIQRLDEREAGLV